MCYPEQEVCSSWICIHARGSTAYSIRQTSSALDGDVNTAHFSQEAKWNTPQRNSRVEDIVIVQDDNLPRDRWPLAIVTKLYPSKDGPIRKVQLLTAERLLERPIRETKLVLLLAQEETTDQYAIPVRGASAADG